MGKEGISVYIIGRQKLREGFLVTDPNFDISFSSSVGVEKGNRRTGKLIEGVSIIDKKGQPIEELDGLPTIDIKDWGRFVKKITEC